MTKDEIVALVEARLAEACPRVLTVADAADACGLTPQTIYRLRRTVPPAFPPGRILDPQTGALGWTPEEIREWIDTRPVETPKPAHRDTRRIEEEILGVLTPNRTSQHTAREIIDTIRRNRSDAYLALANLTERNAVRQHGFGTKGSPFRYSLD